MSVIPHTIDLVVANMATSLQFYRKLGLTVPVDAETEEQAQIYTPGGATLGFVTEKLMKETNPTWIEPVGQRVTFSCRCDSPEEVNEVFARMVAEGHKPRKEPWDAFWGQRYAMLEDPDSNRVDLFAAINDEGKE